MYTNEALEIGMDCHITLAEAHNIHNTIVDEEVEKERKRRKKKILREYFYRSARLKKLSNLVKI